MKTICKKIRVYPKYNGPYSGNSGSCGYFNDVVVIDEIGQIVIDEIGQVERTKVECLERFDPAVKNKLGRLGAYVHIPNMGKITRQIDRYQEKYPGSEVEWEFEPDMERYANLPKSKAEALFKDGSYLLLWSTELGRIHRLTDPAQKADRFCRLSNTIFEVLSTEPSLRGEFTELELEHARKIQKNCNDEIESLIPVLQPIWDAEKKSQDANASTSTMETMSEFLSKW